MLEMITLFLGLALGPQRIELAVKDAEVASIEVLLDGRPCGRVMGAPWSVRCDFGSALIPHEIVVLALNHDGDELDRVRRLVNLPTAATAAHWVVEAGTVREPSAVRLIWNSFGGHQPELIHATFDGYPIPLGVDGAITVPPFDPASQHLLHAEVIFTNSLRAHADRALGCCFAESVSAELSSVALSWLRRREPTIEWLSRALVSRGGPLMPVAVEQGPAEVILVREGSEWNRESLMDLYYRMAASRRGDLAGSELRGIRSGDAVRLVFPENMKGSKAIATFPISGDVSEGGEVSLLEIIGGRFFPEKELDSGEQRLADSVATAGLIAAGSGRPRAVVLIRSGRVRDDSSVSPAQARGYLRALRVPLFVWHPLMPGDGVEDGTWEGEIDISSRKAAVEALETLNRCLEEQIIVWVAGSHLPQEIRLRRDTRGARLAE